MKHITASEFASILGVSRQAVHLRLKAGQIRYEQVGRLRVIPESEVEKWKKALPKGEGRASRFITRVKKSR